MDLVVLAGALTAALRPFIRGFRSKGEDLMEDAGGRAAESAYNFAKRIWSKLDPEVQKTPTAMEAADELAVAPADDDAAAVFRVQIRKLLEQDPELTRELAHLVEEGKQAGVVGDVVIHGDVKASGHGIAVGRDFHGGVQRG